jgi:hypothetical protein
MLLLMMAGSLTAAKVEKEIEKRSDEISNCFTHAGIVRKYDEAAS